MRLAGIQGLHRRKFRGCTRRDPDAVGSDDLVNRQFRVDGPDRLWVSDITEHPTAEGKVYVAVVLDAWSRRVVGWSIADHIRASWWSTPCRWRPGADAHPRAKPSVIPTTAVRANPSGRRNTSIVEVRADGDDAGAAAGGSALSRAGAVSGTTNGGLA
jgi:hypothetical protein